MTKSHVQAFDKTLHDKDLQSLLKDNTDLAKKLDHLRQEITQKHEKSFQDLQQKSELRFQEYESMIALYKENQPLSEKLVQERNVLVDQIQQLQKALEDHQKSLEEEQKFTTSLERMVLFYEQLLQCESTENSENSFTLVRNGVKFDLELTDNGLNYMPVEQEGLPKCFGKSLELEGEELDKFGLNLLKYT